MLKVEAAIQFGWTVDYFGIGDLVEVMNEVTEDEIRELLEKTKVMVRTKSIPEVRRFINRFIQKVVVHTDNVEVTFNLDSR